MAEHVADTFARLLTLYRRPDGSEWGGQSLEDATGGVVTRSYVSNLKAGRIADPGLSKLAAIAGAKGFPPGAWFGEGESYPEDATPATLGDPTAAAIMEEVAKLDRGDRELLLRVARGISTAGDGSEGEGKKKGGGVAPSL